MKLIITSGPAEAARYEVDGIVTIGRDPSNDIVIADPSISLIHCQIYFEKESAFVKDLGSTNGVTVNGKRLISAKLRDGDGMVVGKSKIRVEMAPPGWAGDRADLSTMTTVVEAKEPDRAASVPSGERKKELSGNIFGSVTYYLKRKIADGGMGSVYEAEQFGAEGFIKKVAIKTILPDYVKKEQFVSSFVGEAKLVANLVHQNIVQIHHLGRHDDGYYIAMEYIDGINLTGLLTQHRRRRKRVPVNIATYIVSRICRGLEYAHNKTDEKGAPLGLVHRDVSPNNVMITREGEVKLTDFGVAKATRFMEDDEQYLVGSLEYMSPEQANLDPVDRRSDLFSLGLIYYELLTGIRVFLCAGDDQTEKTVERVRAAVIPDPLESRPELPPSVVCILMKCLKKKPEDRFQSARELAMALEQDIYSKGYGPTIVTLAEYVDGFCEQRNHAGGRGNLRP